MKLDAETQFLTGLIELQYGQNVEQKLKKISKKIDWAKDWPNNKISFWNAEAFMWSKKISKEKRALIKKELNFLTGKNLDLGCGAYSYLKSVGFDLSPKMLDFNDNLTKKVQGDVEKKLPFKKHTFNSVTAIFLFNYVNDYHNLLLEIKKVLKKEGTLMLVMSAKSINQWQKQKQVNDFSTQKWQEIISQSGFKVRFYQKNNLWFFKAKKEKLIK